MVNSAPENPAENQGLGREVPHHQSQDKIAEGIRVVFFLESGVPKTDLVPRLGDETLVRIFLPVRLSLIYHSTTQYITN
jgi:hypothetical protein